MISMSIKMDKLLVIKIIHGLDKFYGQILTTGTLKLMISSNRR